MSDLVYMTHPASPEHAPAATTQDAFDALWKAKGWQLVEDNGDAAPAASTPPSAPATPKPAERAGVVVNPSQGG